MKRTRRIFWLAALFLVGGAVVSVVVAEAIGLTSQVRYGYTTPLKFVAAQGMYAQVRDISGTGWRYLDWALLNKPSAAVVQYLEAKHVTSSPTILGEDHLRLDPSDALPSWSALWRNENGDEPNQTAQKQVGYELSEVGLGWPLIAFSMEWDPAHKGERRGGKELAYVPVFRSRILVWRPVPLGFAADTLLYAACLAGLAGGVRMWVRARRRGRGACAACGYDLSGLAAGMGVCPECGGAHVRKIAK